MVGGSRMQVWVMGASGEGHSPREKTQTFCSDTSGARRKRGLEGGLPSQRVWEAPPSSPSKDPAPSRDRRSITSSAAQHSPPAPVQ